MTLATQSGDLGDWFVSACECVCEGEMLVVHIFLNRSYLVFERGSFTEYRALWLNQVRWLLRPLGLLSPMLGIEVCNDVGCSLFCFVLAFETGFLLCRLGCPAPRFEDQAVLELTKIRLPLPPRVLASQVCAMMPVCP